jgi:hypothetical protein
LTVHWADAIVHSRLPPVWHLSSDHARRREFTQNVKITTFRSICRPPDAMNAALTVCYALCVAAFLSYWHTRVTLQFSWTAFALFAAISFTALLMGSAFLARVRGHITAAPGNALRFVCGYLLLSTGLFVMSLASPLTPLQNFSVLLAIAVAANIFRRVPRQTSHDPSAVAAAVLCLVISGIGATLWATDALNLSVPQGDLIVFTLWSDSFFHARQISEFAHASGLASLSDIRLAGVKPGIYHFAVYSVPALVASVSSTGAYEVFASYLLPLGILISGLAAFSLAAFLWGPWAGIAATVGVLLIPDAYQQGFGSRYLSYNFLQQVNPGGLYGVAYAALAWIFILDACRNGRAGSILRGWSTAGLLIAYKAHLFVANALLIIIYPVLFFGRFDRRVRFAVAGVALTLFATVVWVSQHLSGFPTIRLDGSAAWTYMSGVIDTYDAGTMKSLLTLAFEMEMPQVLRAMFYAAALVLGTFGAWAVLFPLAMYACRRLVTRSLLVFPAVVLLNYVVMSLGLALNQKAIGGADELLNRPSVWAYFVVVTWTSGALYSLLFQNRLPRPKLARAMLTATVVAAFAFPNHLAANLQTLPAWEDYRSYRSQSAVPTCLLNTARYIRSNSTWQDIVQDSENDPKLVLTAFAERREYAALSVLVPPSGSELEKRLSVLKALRSKTRAEDVIELARSQRISWYVLHSSTDIAWPASFFESANFICGDIRAFNFGDIKYN